MAAADTTFGGRFTRADGIQTEQIRLAGWYATSTATRISKKGNFSNTLDISYPRYQKRTMVHLKPVSTYAPPSPYFRPLPRNGHLGAADPALAPILSAADAAVAPLWHPALSLDEFRRAWLVPPPAPRGTPREGVDVGTETRMVPMRDGVEREVRIWRARTGPSRDGEEERPGALAMRFHGGGWVVGGHVTEEPGNLMLAGLGGVVVVSVDYRT